MNNPAIQIGDNKVYSGHNLDVLKTLADNSIDSIVTDPPYELGFMGKGWDKSGIAYSVELWQECLRVLKPGGHLLAFGGSRTWHRLAVAIEDAGFEMRDSIAWLYGSGFPKSLDISKAIDKGYGENKARQLQFTAWMRASGLTSAKARDILLNAGLITEKSNQASHYFAATMGSQPAIATADMFDALRPYLPEVPEEIERLVAERTGIEWSAYKNRKVIGQKTAGMGSGKTFGMLQSEGNNLAAEREIDITAPATPDAKKWDGWGTALKPAFEPIVVARKPLIGTVAENVLQFGTGGINVDASRIGFFGGTKGSSNITGSLKVEKGGFSNNRGSQSIDAGRWPANVILDETTAELLDKQSGITKSVGGGRSTGRNFGQEADNDFSKDRERTGHNDSGGASRFFYVAKASKRDRNEGLDELPEVRYADRNATDGVGGDNPRNRTNKAKQNFHPTVKPTTLMTYLIKLVTPEAGIVLDPFAGSGSTGKAAILEGYTFMGIELTEDYLPIIEGRLQHAYETYCNKADDLFE